jgi:hypothetical protein
VQADCVGDEDVLGQHDPVHQMCEALATVVGDLTALVADLDAFGLGKSDSLDAAAVARAVLREPWLPPASFDTTSHELKLLVDRREDLVLQRSATINRFLWRVHDLDPERSPNGRRALRFNVRRKAFDD